MTGETRTRSALLLSANFPPYGGPHRGWYIRSRTLVEALARDGWNVSVVALYRTRMWDSPVESDRVQHRWVRHLPTLQDHVPITERTGAARVGAFVLRAVREALSYLLGDTLPLSLGGFRRHARAMLRAGPVDLVVVSTPPHGLLGIVPWIRRIAGSAATLIVDLRDPCTFGHRFMAKASPLGRALLSRYERRAFGTADEVWVVSKGMRDRYLEKYPEAADRIRIVENGYIEYPSLPDCDRRLAEFVEEQHADGRHVLAFFGSGFFGAKSAKGKRLNILGRLAREFPEIGRAAAFVLQGEISGDSDVAPATLLKVPPAPNAQARANMRAADAGLAVYDNETDADLVLGGKLYDYLAASLPIWILAPANAASFREFETRFPKQVVFSDINDDAALRTGFDRITTLADERRRDPESCGLRQTELSAYERARVFDWAIRAARKQQAARVTSAVLSGDA